ncbi:MAG: 2-phospho-L-lactate transferase [Candidatus Bathyarchaeia archaeon]
MSVQNSLQITALAGGVGASKLLHGLLKLIPEENLTVIVNTGDDLELYGLHISPDLDIVMYTLANCVDESRGWGFKGDTFQCLEMLRTYGQETWFRLGDRDLATHIQRTLLLKSGLKLSEVTPILCRAFGLKVKIIPMTNENFTTIIITDKGPMHFEEFLVKRTAQDLVLGVEYKGVEEAKPAPGVIEAILSSDGIIICPSNPIVSIGTILSIRGVREALVKTKGRVVGVSPIIGGAPVKGPADKLISGLKMEVSAYTVAKIYGDFLDTFIIDSIDKDLKQKIESLGIKVIVTNTIMKSFEDRIRLAETVLQAIRD